MVQIVSYRGLALIIKTFLKYIFKNKTFAILTCILVLSFGGKLSFFNDKSREAVLFIADKLQQSTVTITKAIDIIAFSITKLHKKYDFQKQEEELLRYRLQAESLENTNNILLEQLRFAKTIKSDFIAARLLQISKKFGDETAVISCGYNHKVKVGDVVTTSVGLFGRVKEVFPNYSKVILITNYDSRISFISSIHKERGIIYGNENKLQFKYLDENHSLEEGEVLMTSGESDVIPYGIPIGTVKKSKNNFFAEAFSIKQNIEFVYVYIR